MIQPRGFFRIFPTTFNEAMGPWLKRALCRDYDPEIFFPTSKGPAWRAKRICHSCPVTAECHNAVMQLPAYQRHGVWAGIYYNGSGTA